MYLNSSWPGPWYIGYYVHYVSFARCLRGREVCPRHTRGKIWLDLLVLFTEHSKSLWRRQIARAQPIYFFLNDVQSCSWLWWESRPFFQKPRSFWTRTAKVGQIDTVKSSCEGLWWAVVRYFCRAMVGLELASSFCFWGAVENLLVRKTGPMFRLFFQPTTLLSLWQMFPSNYGAKRGECLTVQSHPATWIWYDASYRRHSQYVLLTWSSEFSFFASRQVNIWWSCPVSI